ncbi:MAG: hypothetical protein NTX96_00135 [Candidatus Zambryskibacteria bacterium]|nr:hypothetical protein [Candidatus Zambryskibacteria bacterium]
MKEKLLNQTDSYLNRQLKVIHNRFIFNNNSIYLYEDIPYVCYGGLIEKLRKLNKEWILKSELINISGNLNKKIKAIKIYKSQIDDENCNIIKEYSRKIKKGRICERIWKIENEK